MAREEERQRDDGETRGHRGIEQIFGDHGGERVRRRDTTAREKPALGRLRQKRTGEGEHFDGLTREPNAQDLRVADDGTDHRAPQRHGADRHVHGVNAHNRREGPADAHEHAHDDTHAFVPDQKDDHPKAKDKEQKADESRQRCVRWVNGNHCASILPAATPRGPVKQRRGLYAGLATSAGIVLGLLLLRTAFTSGYPLAAELLANRLTYIYVFVATALVFIVLGYVLGRQADELRRLSMTDALTGLSNRHAFQVRLRDEWRRSRRYRAPLALLLIDVDGLKRVNDEQGHEAGDRVLREVAGALRHTLRGTDIGARWGGDEFAIIAPNTGREAADRLGRRLLVHLHERTRGGGRSVSVSVGAALFDPAQPMRSMQMLMRAADQALYQAKADGRDRIKAFSDVS
jgi:diguanylate cyclase (GGDEF)-like protein